MKYQEFIDNTDKDTLKDIGDKLMSMEAPELKEDPLVWECACGCSDFLLYKDGDVECSECGRISKTMGCFVR